MVFPLQCQVKKQNVVAPVLNKRLGLVQKVLVLAHDTNSGVVRSVQRHGDVLRAGLGLATNIKKLEDLAKDAEGRLQVDPKHSVIIAVVNARLLFSAAIRNLQTETERFCPAVSESELGAAQPEDLKIAVVELWNRASAQGFEDLTLSEVVMDTVSRVCMVTRDSLLKISTSAKTPLSNVILERSWKKDVPCHEGEPLPSFEDVMDCARVKLKAAIPAAEKSVCKGLLDKFSQEGLRWLRVGFLLIVHGVII